MKAIKRDTRAVMSNNPTALLISEILKRTRKKSKKELFKQVF
jgi:hypothetical protein